jgi:NADH-quinone oxidoreductase subunit N
VFNFNDFVLLVGLIFILVTFLFKIGSVPFHSWLCDVYDGSLISVTLLFAALPKIIIFSVFIKIFLVIFGDLQPFLQPLLILASILSISIGSLSALFQKRVKRLFAYSTISHTGFVLLGIVSFSPEAIKSTIFYILVYTVLTVLLFSFLISAVISTQKFPGYLAS